MRTAERGKDGFDVHNPNGGQLWKPGTGTERPRLQKGMKRYWMLTAEMAVNLKTGNWNRQVRTAVK